MKNISQYFLESNDMLFERKNTIFAFFWKQAQAVILHQASKCR
jgi:hypothetical protein